MQRPEQFQHYTALESGSQSGLSLRRPVSAGQHKRAGRQLRRILLAGQSAQAVGASGKTPGGSTGCHVFLWRELLGQNNSHFVAASQGWTPGGYIHKTVAVIAQGWLAYAFAAGAQKNIGTLKPRHDKAAGVFTA